MLENEHEKKNPIFAHLASAVNITIKELHKILYICSPCLYLYTHSVHCNKFISSGFSRRENLYFIAAHMGISHDSHIVYD